MTFVLCDPGYYVHKPDVQNKWDGNTHTHTHTHTHTETGETWVERKQKCRKERVGSVAANSDNLGSNKEAGGGAQGAQGSSKICTSRESVSPLSRLIRGFRNKYH